MRNLEKITLRWLGVAGLEIGCPGRRIVFDPYVSRVSRRAMLISRIRSDPSLVRSLISPCDAVFISHSHFDHLLDAAETARQSGAVVFGSPNTCRILRAEGLSEGQIRETRPGDTFQIGDLKITVLTERPHPRVAGFGMQSLKKDVRMPLRAREYAMDYGLSFLIEYRGTRLLTEGCRHPSEAGRVDILFTNPLPIGRNPRGVWKKQVEEYVPSIIIPIHWDDLNAPIQEPIRCQAAPTGRFFPPLARFDPQAFRETVESLPGERTVFIPERLRQYSLGEIICK